MQYPVIILGGSSAIGSSIKSLLNKNRIKTITVGRSKTNDINFDISKKNTLEIDTKISGLVNCIGLNKTSFPELTKNERDQAIINANLINVLLIFYNLEKNFAKGSSVVHIGSLANKMLFKDDAAYMISKTGLSGLSKSIASNLSKIGGRSNIINPSYIKTPMTIKSYLNKEENKKRSKRHLRGEWGEVDQIAELVYFLLSSKSNFINCQEINIDDGWIINSLL